MNGGPMRHVGRSQVGRADLIRALAAGESVRADLMELLGWVRIPRATVKLSERNFGQRGESSTGEQESRKSAKKSLNTQFMPVPVPFWRAEQFNLRAVPEGLSEAPVGKLAVDESIGRKPMQHEVFQTLAPMADLLTRLRRLTELERPGCEPDVERLVADFVRGRVIREVPRRPRRAWGLGLHVIQDLSPRLTPYRIDQGLLSLELKELLPKTGLTLSSVRDGDFDPVTHWPEFSGSFLEMAQPGSTVLVLGDLGVLDRHQEPETRRWREFGQRLADRQIRRTALVPCDVSWVPSDLNEVWSILPWDRRRYMGGTASLGEARQMADRLLALLSFAVAIEVELLRRVRCALVEFQELPELEAIVWQHPAIRAAGIDGAMFDQEERARLESVRMNQAEEAKRLAVEHAIAEHRGDYEGVRYAELLNLGTEAGTFFSANEIQVATSWYDRMDRDGIPGISELTERIEFFRMVAPHLGRRARALLPALDRNWARYLGGDPNAVPPADLDPACLVEPASSLRTVHLRLVGADISLREGGSTTLDVGSPLGAVRARADRVRLEYLDGMHGEPEVPATMGVNDFGFRSRADASAIQDAVLKFAESSGDPSTNDRRGNSQVPNSQVPAGSQRQLERVTRTQWITLTGRQSSQVALPDAPRVRIVTDLEELTLGRIERPAWASAMGRDRFGLWAEFDVPERQTDRTKISRRPRARQGVITQRLRWIPPGRFMMGSPSNEPGRFDDESQPVEKVVERGFWLFDTPCTQALWEAVMGENPSYFRSPDRPVESVSWEDCNEFCSKIGSVVFGVRMSLPSEMEWEYACRAGTETAIYTGPLEIIGDGNAPALDSIAWYGGNCGIDFELANGIEVRWLDNKQYTFERGGTHPVGRKLPNAWGLYDMLGNVWEWCEDPWSVPDEHTTESPETASDVRVFRGGSWNFEARRVRAACRDGLPPGNRRNFLGFRCRVQEGELRRDTGG